MNRRSFFSRAAGAIGAAAAAPQIVKGLETPKPFVPVWWHKLTFTMHGKPFAHPILVKEGDCCFVFGPGCGHWRVRVLAPGHEELAAADGFSVHHSSPCTVQIEAYVAPYHPTITVEACDSESIRASLRAALEESDKLNRLYDPEFV